MKITKIIATLSLLGAMASTILAGEDRATQQKPEAPDPPLRHYKSGKMPPAYNYKQRGMTAPEKNDPGLPGDWHPKIPAATNGIHIKP